MVNQISCSSIPGNFMQEKLSSDTVIEVVVTFFANVHVWCMNEHFMHTTDEYELKP